MRKLIIFFIILMPLFADIIRFQDVEDFITKECYNYKSKYINPITIHGIMWCESRIIKTNQELYNTHAVSSDNCVGLMQIKKITLDTYNWRNKTNLTMQDMRDTTNNIRVGIWCLNQKLKLSKKILGEYNLGKALELYSGGARYYAYRCMSKIIRLYYKKK